MSSSVFTRPFIPGAAPSVTATAPASHLDLSFLRQIVYEQTQNVLDPSRDYLFETRLSKLLRSQGITGLADLVASLQMRRNPSMERAIAEAMTINETSFFRDIRPFELLRKELLPPLIEARRHARSLRIWSAACSTGQEAYSLAMLLLEHFPSVSTRNIVIEGTDISSEVVQRASFGTYHRIEMNRGLPARNIVRFFTHEGEDWTVKPEIRRLCNFREANLCASTLPFSEPFDIIFLRNVMLYFSQETRRRLLSNVHRLLAPQGALFLGSSEQPADPAIWTANLSGGTCYYRPRRLA
ncbi:CheR family methyltransferase [Acidicapsa dinghuensis]|uniref:protein-glutamate O-methyltransferase n=1 Tax=Acidicapsa dinghuensis TaxID=2218256 RepID=A0ABW1EJ09_9BACT|nr:protein-glutamate O-methyltransferase CheR [Acidicapsa dinghuensis]